MSVSEEAPLRRSYRSDEDENGHSRYERKREAIIAAAADIINQRGVRAMTLADVSASVGLIKNSLTYYFRRKEDLAVACFLNGIERYDAIIEEALRAPTAPQRLERLVSLYFALDRQIRLGDAPAVPVFNDIRALSEENFAVVLQRYLELFRKARGMFQGPGAPDLTDMQISARVHVALEQLYWSVAWLPQYDVEDFPRIAARMTDILLNGLAPEGATWAAAPLPPGPPPTRSEASEETFLLTATRLINQRGYRGVSIDQISAEINLTKGSFYHHHDAKSDLVIACFNRSFGVMRRIQHAAMGLDASSWVQLNSAAEALMDYQTSDRGPLLRMSALSALPEAERQQMILRSHAISNRFAGMMSDGIAAGDVRPVDPVIASHMLNATLNAAAEFQFWTPEATPQEASALYARPILMGLVRP